MLTYQRLRELLDYEPQTGRFFWKVKTARCVHIGDLAGAIERNGYRRITFGKQRFLAHRLAWLYVSGEWPLGDIDHVNGNKDDNRIENLRAATVAQNAMNKKMVKTNKVGFKGVCLVGGRYQASIKRDGKSIYLGLHDTPEAAHAAYVEKANEIFGEFARAA
jgi:hypothetical protein